MIKTFSNKAGSIKYIGDSRLIFYEEILLLCYAALTYLLRNLEHRAGTRLLEKLFPHDDEDVLFSIK